MATRLDPQTIAAMTGVALGGYVGNIQEDPLGGLLAAGIGGATGTFMKLSIPDLKKASRVITDLKYDKEKVASLANLGMTEQDYSSITRSQKFVPHLRKGQRLASKWQKKIETLTQSITEENSTTVNEKIANITRRLDPLKQRLQETEATAFGYLKSQGVNVKTLDDVEKFTMGNKNGNIAATLNVLRVGDVKLQKAFGLGLQPSREDVSQVFRRDDQHVVKNISKYLQSQMGNTLEEANLKASLLVEKSFGENLVFNNHSVAVETEAGKVVNIPMTARKDKFLYHTSNSGVNYAVTGLNPYGSAYNRGSAVPMIGEADPRIPNAKDLVKAIHPELVFLNSDLSLEEIAKNTRSAMQFDNSDFEGRFQTGHPIPEKIKGIGTAVNLDFTYNLDHNNTIDPQRPFRKIDKVSKAAGSSSELASVISNLSQDLSAGDDVRNLFYLQSLNDITKINPESLMTTNPMAMNARAASGLGRDTTPALRSKEAQELSNIFGERFTRPFESANVLKKSAVNDSKLFNDIATSLYGDRYALGDGSGFFNNTSEVRGKLTHGQEGKIKIPQHKGNYLLGSLSFKDGEVINTNELTSGKVIKPSDVLAYDLAGKPIQVHSRWTAGALIRGSSIDRDGSLVLDVFKGFTSAEEETVKIFSESSKAVVTKADNFQQLQAIAELVNSGEIVQTENGFVTKSGVAVNDDYLMKYAKDNKLNADILIQGDSSHKLLSGSLAADNIDDLLGNVRKSGMFSEGVVANIAELGGSDLSKTKAATLMHLMTSNHRSGTDLAHSVALDLQALDPSAKNIMQQITTVDGLVGKNSAAVQQQFLELAKQLNFNNYALGRSVTTATLNKGMSEIGAGNNARLSWTAMSNLLKSGFTKEELGHFGKQDFKTTLELKSLVGEYNNGVGNRLPTINKHLRGKETDFSRTIFSNVPEARSNQLKSLGIDVNSDFITYELQNSNEGGLRRLNFATVSTDRSGRYTEGDKNIFKELESKKLSVYSADIAVSRATSSIEKHEKLALLDKAIASYKDYSLGLMTGDGSLVKRGASLYSDRSMITMVGTVGGQAEKYVEMQNKSKISTSVFVSRAGAEERARRMGVSLIEESVEGFKNLKSLHYLDKEGNKIPFKALLTREPAQGPLSSVFADVMVDSSLENKATASVTYATENNKAYVLGQFGDKDQDSLQELYPKFKSQAEFNQVNDKFTSINETLFDTIDLGEQIKVKGKSKEAKTIFDLYSETSEITDEAERLKQTKISMSNFLTQAGLQGRERKTLSPAATELATKFSQALVDEFGTGKESLKARFGVHYLVENLLKSAHMKTEDLALKSEGLTEELTRLRQQFVKGSDPEGKAYREGLERILPQFLNLDSIKEETARNAVQDMIENIKTAELRHAKDIDKVTLYPTDLKRQGFVKGEENSLLEFLEQGGLIDTETGSGYNDLNRSVTNSGRTLGRSIKMNLSQNKGVLGLGAAALLGAAMMSRSSPSLDANQTKFQHSSKMIRGTNEESPLGINTNTQNRSYITPKDYSENSNISVEGVWEQANAASDLTSVGTLATKQYELTRALFGDQLRSVKIDM